MIKQFVSIVLVIASLAGVTALGYSTPVLAASADCEPRFLTFPPWYRNLVDKGTSDCKLKSIGDDGDISLRDFITVVVINVVEIILQLVAYAAAIMLVIGGFRYITSTGDQNSMTSAKKTITNSIIGLIISLLSVAIVNAVAGVF